MASQAMLDLRSEVISRFPTARDGGIDDCRKISGSSRWSQHAYGNAWDCMVPSLGVGDQINRWVAANKVRLGIGTVLWRVKDHFDHLHIEGANKGFGTPVCAGGLFQSVPQATGGAVSIPGLIPGESVPNTGVLSGIGAAANILTALGDPMTYLRALWAVGGAVALGYSVALAFAVFSDIDLAALAKTAVTKGKAK